MLLFGGALVALAVRHCAAPSARRWSTSRRCASPPSGATIGGALFRLTIGATPFLWPLMFQLGFGMTAFLSGLLVMACTGGDLGIQACSRPMLRRFGIRSVLVFNGVLTTADSSRAALFTRATPVIVIVLVLVAIGIRSLQFTSLGSLAYSDVPPAR